MLKPIIKLLMIGHVSQIELSKAFSLCVEKDTYMMHLAL